MIAAGPPKRSAVSIASPSPPAHILTSGSESIKSNTFTKAQAQMLAPPTSPPTPLQRAPPTQQTAAAAAAFTSSSSVPAVAGVRPFGAAPPIPVKRGSGLTMRRGRGGGVVANQPQYVDLFNS
uniref:Aspartyl/glutamyl-tRNA(Asn/Gln) amidotransferase subunit C n=1 Tax=Lygus hesperus TaxID=30085 RepID=A0A0A9W1P7_LYGHE